MKKVIIFNDHILPKDIDRELWSGGTTIKTVAYTDYQALEKKIRELEYENLHLVYNHEAIEKEVKELKEHLQVKKLADSPIIAMIDNKPVHQDEYEALKKELKEALNIIKDF